MDRILRGVTGRMHRNVDIGSYSGFVFLFIHKALIEGLWFPRDYTKLWIYKDALDMVPAF